ncbi:MAG: glycosyltransferase family 2 protein [Parahaliea sp.]
MNNTTDIQCCLLVPVYNHANTLAPLLTRLLPYGLPVFLINDGSGSYCTHTLQTLARKHEAVILIERDHNGGKGAAVKSGLRAAHKQGFSHALQIDADGQHNTDDICALLQCAHRQPQALITGIPLYDNAPRLRYYGRYLTHVWVWIHTLSMDIKDALCGFRVYPLSATLAIINTQHTGNRMDFDPEILVRLHWAGVNIVQYRTRVDYPSDGISHFRSIRDNALISWAHTRLFFGMLKRLPKLLRRKLKRSGPVNDDGQHHA